MDQTMLNAFLGKSAMPPPGNLKNVNSGQMLDVNGGTTANGILVDLWPSNGGTNQQWKFQ